MAASLSWIRRLVRHRRYHITDHAAIAMLEDSITTHDLESAILSERAEVIEDYPRDPSGPSCLVLGWIEPSVPLHIVVGYLGGRPDIITVYRPDPQVWTGFRGRR